MANRKGTPIWYELMSNEPEASKAFYDDVFGWNVQPAPAEGQDYRMIQSDEGFVGGVLKLTPEMCAGGAKPTWLTYFGVDDVDATAALAQESGGSVLLPPFDIPDIGRVAMISDPQGIPLYVMRGASDQDSTVFERTGMGKCNWNELTTPDQASANAFYAKVFGFTYPDKMSMGDLGDYVFVAVGDTTLGATMKAPAGAPIGWKPYFRAPNIDVAAETVKKRGGAVLEGPHEVPGGDRVLVARDPHGVVFGIAAPGS